MAKKKHGRPSTYNDETADEIYKRISEGETLRAICREDHMPPWQTVYSWMRINAKFSERIAHARDLGYDAIAEEILDIADDATNDWMERQGDKDSAPGYVLNGEHVQRSKLRIESRLKLLAKWNPKKYGESLKLDAQVEGNLTVELVRFADKAAK